VSVEPSADTSTVTTTMTAPAPRPLLRGWLHLICFVLAVPTAALVIALADGLRARLGAAVYAVGLVALFGVSGLYHRVRWSPAWRQRMQRLDHATIFVMIAGSYTPLCLLALKGWVAASMLVLAWAGAGLGAALAWSSHLRASKIRSALYIVLGWAAVASAPQLLSHLSTAEIVLVVIGGVLFTVGAVFLFTRWPDPLPRIFGYHEVWHTLVVAAVVCHLVAIGSVIDGAA